MEVKNENGIIKYTFNDEEEQIIDWAVKKIIDCYIAKGGDKDKMMSESEIRNYIDGIMCRDGIYGVKKYIALENNTIINVDERLNERKIGKVGEMEWKDFARSQMKDFDFKLPDGESLNQTKKRMVEAMKNILMFETDNRVAAFDSPYTYGTTVEQRTTPP